MCESRQTAKDANNVLLAVASERDVSMSESEKALSASDIFAVDDQRIERVEVPEWDGHVFVKSITGTERDAFESAMVSRKGKGKSEVDLTNVRASLVARAACTAEGVRLFDDAQASQLGAKSASALDRVYTVADRLSGLSEEDVEELAEDFLDTP